MKVRIGAVVVEFLCDREEIRDHISHLLRYHKAGAEAAACTVRFQLDETLERNQSALDGPGAYLCRYAPNFLENATQRFYYRVLFPVLQRVCCDRAQMMVHGAERRGEEHLRGRVAERRDAAHGRRHPLHCGRPVLPPQEGAAHR